VRMCKRYDVMSTANDDPAFAIRRKEMFIAMNRFRVKRGAEGAFEKIWLSRDSYLDRVPGFVEFHLLKGPDAEDHMLYASHTVWQSKAAFEAWTKSEEFRAAHARAGNDATGPLYSEHPNFEGFEVRQGGGRITRFRPLRPLSVAHMDSK
jgi:heme-degrading monooxygenase HmoA